MWKAVAGLMLVVSGACSSSGPTDALDVLPNPFAVIADSALARSYQRDATDLAIRQLRRGRPAEAQSVEISPALVASLENALLAVYQSRSAARDSVVAAHGIHVFPVSRDLLVAPEPSSSWGQAWAAGKQVTGNSEVDALVARYALSVTWHPLSGFAQLSTARPINIVPVAAAFARIGGVKYSEPNGYAGDGSDITAYALPGGWRLDYSLGSGDCLAGCINRRYWTFEISNNGDVRFTGQRDDPTQPPRE